MIILFYVFFILDRAILVSVSNELNIFALLLFGYGIATGPFSYMASKEGPDAYASILAVFVAQISFIVFAASYLFDYPAISIPIILLIVFGIEIFQLYIASLEFEFGTEEQETSYYENESYGSIQENEIDEYTEDDIQDDLEYGISLLKNKEYDQALITFNNIIDLDDSIKEAYYYRAAANKFLGRKNLMWGDLQIAAQLGHKQSIELLQKKEQKEKILKDDPPTISQQEYIIIIDDEETLRNILIDYFKTKFKRIEYIGFENGNNAVEFIKKHSKEVKIIISDINHLGINGIEILKLCTTMYPGIRFIIHSAFLNENNFNECRKYTEYVLHKPIKIENLFNLINTILHQRGGT